MARIAGVVTVVIDAVVDGACVVVGAMRWRRALDADVHAAHGRRSRAGRDELTDTVDAAVGRARAGIVTVTGLGARDAMGAITVGFCSLAGVARMLARPERADIEGTLVGIIAIAGVRALDADIAGGVAKRCG